MWTVYDGVNPYADFDGTGSLTTRYLADPRRPDVLFARVAANGTTAWYLRDNINSVRQVVSPTGTVLNAITYDSFGNVLSETNPANGDRFKYTGREYDAELGIYYYRARYYGSATGRFLGEDPKGFGAGDANLYRYVGNQPTGRIDPMGLDWPDTVAGWIGVDNVRSWDNYLGDYRTGWFAQGSNYFAGYSDSLSFGLTSYFRQGLGYDSVVDYSDAAYLGGQITGMGHSFLLGYGAAGRVPQAGTWACTAYRGAQRYTVAGSVYGVGHSSYVLATDPQNFGFTDALGFVPRKKAFGDGWEWGLPEGVQPAAEDDQVLRRWPSSEKPGHLRENTGETGAKHHHRRLRPVQGLAADAEARGGDRGQASVVCPDLPARRPQAQADRREPVL
jgi:RHS repeat-associated protein